MIVNAHYTIFHAHSENIKQFVYVNQGLRSSSAICSFFVWKNVKKKQKEAKSLKFFMLLDKKQFMRDALQIYALYFLLHTMLGRHVRMLS